MKTPVDCAGGVAAVNASLNPGEGGGGAEKKNMNSELWQACAGPLVSLPAAGTHVIYFPQGHSEQVAASMKKDLDAQIPRYPNLPSKLLCLLHDVTLHADTETDEVYAQMTLQPVPSYDKDALVRSDLSMKSNKPQTEFFFKTLTASDTSTHGGFSVPRCAAEKIFPPLDFSMQPPAQELVAKDLHDTIWTFRHIYRGQPKRHLLTTGWSLFISGKRLLAGDSVLFVRDEKQHLLLGIRRANRQSTNLSSSVLSSDSMHIGILAAAAHAAANSSPFTVFYNPRASPSEFVIPLAKYCKAVCSNQVSLGMRFRMMFETEDLGTRRYMGTITGTSDFDPVRWKNSQWRNLQVGWDEAIAGERCTRVSMWDIEPVTAPFLICPPPSFRSKCPRQPGMADENTSDLDNLFKRTMPWLGDDICMKDPQGVPGLSLVQWMDMQQNTSLGNSIRLNYVQSSSGCVMQNLAGSDISCQMGLPAPQIHQPNSLQSQQAQQLDQLPKLPSSLNHTGSVIQPQQQLSDIAKQARQNSMIQTLPLAKVQSQILHPQALVQSNIILQQLSSIGNQRLFENLPQSMQQQQHLIGHKQQQGLPQSQLSDQVNQPYPMPGSQIQLQLFHKLQQQKQSILAQQSVMQQPIQLQDPQKQPLDASQSFCRSMAYSQLLEIPQATPNSAPLSNAIQQQWTRNINQTNTRVSHPPQQPNLQVQHPGTLSEMPGLMGHLPCSTATQINAVASSILTATAGAGQSGITDDVPSCSTSPSTNSCPNMVQPLMSSRAYRSTIMGEDMAQSTATVLSPNALDNMPLNASLIRDLQQQSDVKSSLYVSKTQTQGNFLPQTYTIMGEDMAHSTATVLSPNDLDNMPLNASLIRDLQQKSDVKSSLYVSKTQTQGNFLPQTYLNGASTHTEYLDASSSTTSVCLSRSDPLLQQNNNSAYNLQPLLLRDTNLDGEVHADPRYNIPYGANINGQLALPTSSDQLLRKGTAGLGKDIPSHLSSGSMLANCENSKDPQQELSSSIVSQSFGVPDMAFNSIDSNIGDSNFLNRGAWAPPPQFQHMRTYTKVYKRGAVGRSIDIAHYSGYDELKHDLARRFGIEGQLEDGQRIGWKLVYVDHENDVLLVGDDPWEEFVNCVRYIKILSPQEVQQMSLDGDFGNGVLPNQACSSSDNGNP